jgi:hypothetical protein
MILLEDTDMLYLKALKSGVHTASVFIRNSGTEDKTGVSLRGPLGDKERLLNLGESVLRLLMTRIKDSSSAMAAAERELLVTAAVDGAPSNPVSGLSEAAYRQLLSEVGVKQGFLTGPVPGVLLTGRGKWYLSSVQSLKRDGAGK